MKSNVNRLDEETILVMLEGNNYVEVKLTPQLKRRLLRALMKLHERNITPRWLLVDWHYLYRQHLQALSSDEREREERERRVCRALKWHLFRRIFTISGCDVYLHEGTPEVVAVGE
ncbi:MAG: hypothetical protein DRJ38_00265 [Thermoprotei archaeon]|mgnify:CR=1 FL=1|nr:MAG: hypothetical protein DRJ38_00265 [Thermoprotei archaeon]